MKTHKVLGMMSGTSLDGLDLCLSRFYYENKQWRFKIIATETIEYPDDLKQQLIALIDAKADDLAYMHQYYGEFLGKEAKRFLTKRAEQANFIASHGHTIFHQPNKKYGFQVGSGAAIAANAHLPVVCDFRSTDLSLGGQGAPLVPIGDEYLFNTYSACVNLGGFANLSYHDDDKRVGFDICPVNIILNKLSKSLGKDFDFNGEIARTGTLRPNLLNQLNALAFYKDKAPKSLGQEWLEQEFESCLAKFREGKTEDLIATITHHAAYQISEALKNINCTHNVLLTGGGAKNKFLIELISSNQIDVVLPNEKLIDFKEALIFGFLGVLRWEEKTNVIKAVTGAQKDSISGAIYFV